MWSDDWIVYANGNYTVKINKKTGTKIKDSPYQKFLPMFAESIDCNINNYCNIGCQICYQDCSIYGKRADLKKCKPIIDSLHAYTELAINGNDLTHPHLIDFLKMVKEKNVIANLTVNQSDFLQHQYFIDKLLSKEYIYGLGVSMIKPTLDFVREIMLYPTATIHVVNGLITEQDLYAIQDRDLKLLILGYKNKGRGKNYYKDHEEEIVHSQHWLKTNILKMQHRFPVIGFDTLAVEQLELKQQLPEEEWKTLYAGDDGEFTFYLDLVDMKFASSSMSERLYKIDDGMTVDDMFKIVKGENVNG